VICDHEMFFTHCYTGQPGSVHDQRVFRLSGVQAICDNDDNFPNDSHIIGDAVYSIQKHVLVPFKYNGHLTARQKNYNFCLSSACIIVEQSIGLLKLRFRSLLDKLPMTRIDLIPRYIIACCVLHNICLIKKDFIDLPLAVNVQENILQGNINLPSRQEGVRKHNIIINMLPIRI